MTVLDTATDFTRDRYGRPLVAHPDTGKKVPYGRPSSFGKCIDDTYNLELWAKRKVAQGIKLDQSIYATAISLPIDDTSKENKSAWNTVCEKALAAAKTHAAADTGTALHLMTERIDRGEVLDLPDVFALDVDAYRLALAGAGLSVVPGQVELHVVCDELQLAGTFDRIVTDGTRYFIADLKTGTSVDFPHGYAVQLAIYSRSKGYDIANDARFDLPPVDQAEGVIIHLPSGQGRCEVRMIDLEAGWEAARHAHWVKTKWQKNKGLLGPAINTQTPPAETEGIRSRTPVRNAVGEPKTSPLRDAQATRKAIDDKYAWANEGPPEPTFTVNTAPDEGRPADPASVVLLRAKLNELSKADVGARLWLSQIMREAQAAGCTLDLKANPSLRRFEACRGLYLLAKHGRTFHFLDLLIEAVPGFFDELAEELDGESIYEVGAPPGAYLGQLDADQATQFAHHVDQLVVNATPTADAVA